MPGKKKAQKAWRLWLLLERGRGAGGARFASEKKQLRKSGPEENGCCCAEEEATSGEQQTEEIGLLGFLIAKLHPAPVADLRIERLAVVEGSRGRGYGDRLT